MDSQEVLGLARWVLDNVTCSLAEYIAVNPGEGERDYAYAAVDMVLPHASDVDRERVVSAMCRIMVH